MQNPVPFNPPFVVSFDANAEGTAPLTTGKTGKGGSDYELLTVVLMILGALQCRPYRREQIPAGADGV